MSLLTGRGFAGFGERMIISTLKDATLYQFPLTNGGQAPGSPKQYFDEKWGRLRDICVSPDGRVYICTSSGGDGDLLLEISQPGS